MFSACLVISAAGLLMARYLVMRTISNFAGLSCGQEAFDVCTESRNPKDPSGRWILYLSAVWKRKKIVLFKNAKYFPCSPKRQVSDIANFSGNAALGFMWKILGCINDEQVRLLLLNNEGACSQSHLPERNQMLIRNSFSMPELPRSQNVGWE